MREGGSFFFFYLVKRELPKGIFKKQRGIFVLASGGGDSRALVWFPNVFFSICMVHILFQKKQT